jgi:error-prone DNA polymerase
MMVRGYTAEYAQKVFKQLEGFGSYGFPESHAASFALLVYISSWIKCFYPDVFATALLNSLPMGFYQPAQIVQDAQKHGVEFRPVDVNFSEWDNTMEKSEGKYFAIRLGFRQVKGLRQQDMLLLMNNRKTIFKDLQAISSIGLSQNTLALLAAADAFQSMFINRRTALWQLAVQDKPFALFSGHTETHPEEADIKLPAMLRSEEVLQDYATSALSLKAHPVSFLREKLGLLHIVKNNALNSHKNGDPIKVAGLVLVRQRPETAKGVWFITIEDETGCANLVVFKNVADASKKEILKAKLLMAEGTLQIEGEVIHIIVKKCYDISRLLSALVFPNAELELPKLSRADEMSSFNQTKDKQAQLNIFPGARNFR